MEKFYLAVKQSVLLYGADLWMVSRQDMNRLKTFHGRTVQYMTGENIRKVLKSLLSSTNRLKIKLSFFIYFKIISSFYFK